MAVTVTALDQIYTLGFDSIIDVRSPAEWAEDHVPGAINLPVLDNEERAQVGTIYKQQSPFMARKVGGALVAKNAAHHLQTALIDKQGGWKPLVYCWRGGQRSGSFASILQQVGWRADVVAGGYKTWRGLVVDQLYHRPVAPPVVVLEGNTGSAKTEILALLAQRGVQVLDLEGLARHRGSLFGGQGPQPSQKLFERDLALALAGYDPARPVVIESESSKIGNCRLPPPLWQAMCRAPRITLHVPREWRARYLTESYADLLADPIMLCERISLLRFTYSREQIEKWQNMAKAGQFFWLADELMRCHYDPRYEKHRARRQQAGCAIEVPALTRDTLPAIAGQVEQALAGLIISA